MVIDKRCQFTLNTCFLYRDMFLEVCENSFLILLSNIRDSKLQLLTKDIFCRPQISTSFEKICVTSILNVIWDLFVTGKVSCSEAQSLKIGQPCLKLIWSVCNVIRSIHTEFGQFLKQVFSLMFFQLYFGQKSFLVVLDVLI